jgi:hypothetical protein
LRANVNTPPLNYAFTFILRTLYEGSVTDTWNKNSITEFLWESLLKIWKETGEKMKMDLRELRSAWNWLRIVPTGELWLSY